MGDGPHPHASGSTDLNEPKTLHPFLFLKKCLLFIWLCQALAAERAIFNLPFAVA